MVLALFRYSHGTGRYRRRGDTVSRCMTSVVFSISVPDSEGRRYGPAEHVDHDEDWWSETIYDACLKALEALNYPSYVYIG